MTEEARGMMTHIPNGELPKCTRPKTTFEECHAHSGENCMNAFQCELSARELVYQVWQLVSGAQSSYMAGMENKAAALIEQRDARIRAESAQEIAALKDVIRELLSSEYEDDPRIEYVEVQIDKTTIAEARALLKGEPNE